LFEQALPRIWIRELTESRNLSNDASGLHTRQTVIIVSINSRYILADQRALAFS
jgi:hypothetical protein